MAWQFDPMTAIGTVSAWSIIGHALDTFPAQSNRYAAWFIGSLQYAVGMRTKARENGVGSGSARVRDGIDNA